MNAKRIISVSLALIILICSTFVTSVSAYELPLNFYVAEEGTNPSDIDGRVFGYVGDTDVSEVVNIKDATVIQKYLANLFELSDAAIYVADVNFSGRIDIRDATAIQKWIANYDVDAPISRLLYSVDIVVDFTQFAYDEGSDTYYALDTIVSLGGTFRAADMIKKASYTVADVNGKVLVNREIDPKENWSLDNIAFVVGENYINITIEYTNGDVSEKNFIVNNVCEENMESLDVDKNDDDNDGVLNFTEELYGTNKTKADTDGDGISDYFEMAVLALNPLAVDTDENGVDDGDEDADNDGITNIEEIVDYDTDPICVDTDGDSLSDFDEIKIHLTDPKLTDTDGDEKNDYWELQNGYNPSSADEAFATFDEADVPDGITVVTDGYISITEYEDDTILNDNTPGYIGNAPVYVEMENGTTADVTFDYDPSQLEEGEIPGLYYYDEEAQSYEKVESVVDESGQVTSTITKPGVYILLNHRLVEEVWDNDILKPSDVIDDGSMDIVFVIDCSGSMSDNDPNGIRKDVTKEFISKLRDGVDKAAVVKFTTTAETLMPLTDDKETLINVVDGIPNSDGGGCGGAGTNGSAGIRNAITELENSTADHKYIIFLTDGDDTEVSEDYGDETGTFGLTGEAKGKDIVIHTVGLVGSGSVDTDLLKRVAEGTGGNYYLATVGDPEVNEELVQIYDEIEGVTIDRYLDSNDDGISDYYTKMLCDNRLGSGTGLKNIFGAASYDEVQKSDDLDGDGLKNGEEIKIVENGMGVYAKINSYPYLINSDNDYFDDYAELKVYFSNALRFNEYAEVADVDWVTNSSNFISNKYKEFYDSKLFGALEEGSVFIGNAFFGTTYEITTLYQAILVDYFANINEHLLKESETDAAEIFAKDLTYEVFDAIKAGIKSITDEEGFITNEEELDGYYDLTVNILNTFPGIFGNVLQILQAGKGIVNSKQVAGLLEEAIAMAESLDGSWLNRSANGFASSADYYKYCDGLFDQYRQAQETVSSLQDQLKVTQKIEKFGKVTNIVNYGFIVVDVAIEGYESYKECQNLLANFKVIENNIYILDVLISQDTDPSINLIYDEKETLSIAARNIKETMIKAYNKDYQNMTEMFLDYNFAPVICKGFGEFIHACIGEAGIPGLIIELVRTLGNLLLNIADVAQECTMLYAISITADVLSDHYLTYLNAGNGAKSQDYWLFYKDSENLALKYLLNLFVVRITAEEQMIEADKENSFLVEWLFRDFIYKESECNNNITKCDSLVLKYTA